MNEVLGSESPELYRERGKELLFLEIGKARIKELQGLKKALTVG